ncbi:uncharacterized protein LOC131943282 isoform X2 [Physella acuta]|uniref:uncharacterized protein LOC131943282 isoform X2 n=1 Tax=Physella acuta TaxID=109671 RepID=UPI0027DDCC5D|nr:uncharacterized protein LOC131943282 isoform X2 [Physella acuta]
MFSKGSYDGFFIGDGEQRTSNWKLGAKIAPGKYRYVYHVNDLNNRQTREIAVKQAIISDDVNTDSLKEIDKEMEALKRVKHKRIVTYYGYSRTERVFSLFIAYMEMGSLSKYTSAQTNGHLTEEQTAKFTYQILEGLHYLHSNKIIHRNIKGSNILLKDENNIKISDFGVAKILNTLSRASTQGKGTVSWMAPEMFQEVSHDYKVDIWSLGCTVFQMITGKIPFSEMSVKTVIIKGSNNQLELSIAENCSLTLQDFLRQACEKDPCKRASASSLMEHSFLKEYFNKPTIEIIEEDEESVISKYNFGLASVEDVKNNVTNINYKLKIQSVYPQLLDQLDSEVLTPYFIQHNLLNLDEIEEITCLPTRKKKAEKLLFTILKKDKPKLYEIFLMALSKTGYEHIVKLILEADVVANDAEHTQLYAWIEQLPQELSHKRPDEAETSRLGTAIGNNWQGLMLVLGFNTVEIETTTESCKDILRTKCELILRWRQRKQSSATYCNFLAALVKAEEEHSTTIDWERVKKFVCEK